MTFIKLVYNNLHCDIYRLVWYANEVSNSWQLLYKFSVCIFLQWDKIIFCNIYFEMKKAISSHYWQSELLKPLHASSISWHSELLKPLHASKISWQSELLKPFHASDISWQSEFIPTAHNSDSPLLRQPITLTAHYSDSPFFRQCKIELNPQIHGLTRCIQQDVPVGQANLDGPWPRQNVLERKRSFYPRLYIPVQGNYDRPTWYGES